VAFWLNATPRGRPYNAVTKLREIPACKSSFLEVHVAQGVTTWVPTHAPQPLVTRPGVYLPSFRTMHVVHPWAWPSPGSYLSQGFSRGGVGISRIGLPPTGTGTMALKPPFSSLYYCSEVPGPKASLPVPWPLTVPPPPRSSLPVGIGGWHHRRPHLVTPQHGDTHTWRRPHLVTPQHGDAQSGQPIDFLPWAPWRVPPHVWLWL